MGMAASQARLLSITSRMADNELRSQIINNSKMRLATESSKVSEEYINALNSATMMMSNYDTAGESQYQKLSFNSLTSYSSYNNQYGLVNANGKLLVSEKDAQNYRNIMDQNGDLDDFLALYGLEYKSTYFTSDTLGAEQINFEDIGEIYTIAELEEMYYGSNDILSYNNSLQSSEYINFSDYYNEYILADENYTIAVADAINNDLFGDSWDDAYSEYISSDPSGMQVDDFKAGLQYITDILNRLQSEDKLSADNAWFKDMHSVLNSISISGNSCTITSNVAVKDNGDGTYQIGDTILINTQHEHDEDNYDTQVSIINSDSDDEITTKVDGQDSVCFNGTGVGQNISFTYSETESDDDGTSYTSNYIYKYQTGDNYAQVSYTTTDSAEVQSFLYQVFTEFRSGITSAINRDKYGGTDPAAVSAKQDYNNAINKLIGLVFGNVDTDTKTLIENNKQIFDNNPATIIKWAKENGIQTSDSFEIIKNIYILDSLFNVYGEPSAGWIDVNNPDENADAKVQWYTNLYNRMQQGYSVLEDGLASSNEWIQFALESGLVTMEQVDKSNNWTSTIYTNCSDITEVTDDTAVTIAEAEYNKAMNNIENKDKRYDMELKNIDTEHNSLQTEYDSVKSVIDKNIERSFKIYS